MTKVTMMAAGRYADIQPNEIAMPRENPTSRGLLRLGSIRISDDLASGIAQTTMMPTDKMIMNMLLNRNVKRRWR